MNKTILFITLLALLVICSFTVSINEGFISTFREYKNRHKRRARHIVKDGFTQMKSFFQ